MQGMAQQRRPYRRSRLDVSVRLANAAVPSLCLCCFAARCAMRRRFGRSVGTMRYVPVCRSGLHDDTVSPEWDFEVPICDVTSTPTDLSTIFNDLGFEVTWPFAATSAPGLGLAGATSAPGPVLITHKSRYKLPQGLRFSIALARLAVHVFRLSVPFARASVP